MKVQQFGEAMDFDYLLLENYKKINLSERDLSVILMIEHLSKQGNDLITPDSLSLKMTLKPAEIDETIVSLMKKKYLSYELNKNKMTASLDGLKKRLYSEFAKSIRESETTLLDDDKAKRLSFLSSFYESQLSRSLSPLEMSSLTEWISNGFSDNDIKDSLLNALALNQKSFRSVERILREKRRALDNSKEGMSAVNEKWSKDIEETMKIAKRMWGDDK